MRRMVVFLGMFLLSLASHASAATRDGPVADQPERATLRNYVRQEQALDEQGIPVWEGEIPMVAFGPSCQPRPDSGKAAGDTFDLRLKRGIQLVYASPITVSEWRNPQSSCQRFNARLKLHGSRFRWQSWEKIQESMQRVRFQQYFSYVWSYDDRNVLQRLEPGLLFFGKLDSLPSVRLILDMDLADYFRLRLAHTMDLAALDNDAWHANLDYTF